MKQLVITNQQSMDNRLTLIQNIFFELAENISTLQKAVNKKNQPGEASHSNSDWDRDYELATLIIAAITLVVVLGGVVYMCCCFRKNKKLILQKSPAQRRQAVLNSVIVQQSQKPQQRKRRTNVDDRTAEGFIDETTVYY